MGPPPPPRGALVGGVRRAPHAAAPPPPANRRQTPSAPSFSRAPAAALPLYTRILDLADNGAAGQLPDLTDNQIVWANFSGNAIGGALPADWGRSAGSLQVLSLRGNNISGGAAV